MVSLWKRRERGNVLKFFLKKYFTSYFNFVALNLNIFTKSENHADDDSCLLQKKSIPPRIRVTFHNLITIFHWPLNKFSPLYLNNVCRSDDKDDG